MYFELKTSVIFRTFIFFIVLFWLWFWCSWRLVTFTRLYIQVIRICMCVVSGRWFVKELLY
jgi:hypothetical protein